VGVLNNLGPVHRQQGHHAEAVEHHGRSSALCRAAGDLREAAVAVADRVRLPAAPFFLQKSIRMTTRRLDGRLTARSPASS
jgi:hypothetical protein